MYYLFVISIPLISSKETKKRDRKLEISLSKSELVNEEPTQSNHQRLIRYMLPVPEGQF